MPLPRPNSQWPPAPFDVVATALDEAQAWWEGSPSRLADLYDGAPRGASTSLFDLAGMRDRLGWSGGTSGSKSDTPRRVHVPVAADLAAASATLLLPDPASFRLADNGGNDKAAERVDLILNNPRMHSAMLEGAETCAALGGTFPRLVWDSDVSDHVWIDFVDADQAIPEFVHGRLTAVLFWRVLYSDRADVVLRHFEYHTRGAIHHALYRGSAINVGRRIDLREHPETESIPVNSEGLIPTRVPGLTAAYIPNVRPNPGWRKLGPLRHLGRSDFTDPGIISLMDLVDDAYSSLAREIRLARARLIVSETLVDTGKPGQGSAFDVDREAFLVVAGSPAQAPVLELKQAMIRVDDHLKAAEAYTREIVRRAGYSPSTLGLADDVAMTATEVDAQVRQSVATSKAKVGHWVAGLSELAATAVQLDAQVFRTGAQVSEVEVEFAPPVRESTLQRAQTVLALEQARAVSLATKVAMLHPEWDETRREAEVNAIRAEQSFADPLLLGDDEPFAAPGDTDTDTEPDLDDQLDDEAVPIAA